jgi:tetratricopeptide (TPR) repeat protein
MYKKQIIVIAIVVAIMCVLYNLPIVGLTKAPQAQGHTNTAAPEKRPVNNVTVEMVSAAGKIAIGAGLSQQITNTEGDLKNAGDEAAKLSLQKKLAKEWDDVNQPAPAAFYYQEIASKENTFEDWLTAGNRFNEAFRYIQDTLSQPAFVSNAISCLKKATKMQPGNLDAKTGLGIAYVNQTTLGITDADGGSPMQGIMLLLDVVKQDPNNISANFNLGMFAVTSRQFDKAIQRFKTVIAHSKSPGFEPYFYLAESYKQLGMKTEAIEAYEKSKVLMPDTAIDRRIDDYIKALKN